MPETAKPNVPPEARQDVPPDAPRDAPRDAASEAPHADLIIDEQGVATLSITGIKQLNIIGSQTIAGLTQMLERLAGEPRLRVLVLRGARPGTFIGGADINEMSALTAASAPAFITRLKLLCDALRNLPVPVIARLSGWCLGAGLEVAMACDLRLADIKARFGMPEVKVGIPSVIHAALMPRLIGQSRATWMLLTGEPISASAAQEWGLVHKVHATDQLDTAVDTLARQLAALAPQVLRQQKRLLRSWEGVPVDQAVAASVAEFAKAFTTGEPQREMAAFLQRKG